MREFEQAGDYQKELLLSQEALSNLKITEREWLRVFYGKPNHEWIENKLRAILEASGADKSLAIIAFHEALEIDIEEGVTQYLAATTVFNKTVQKFLIENWKRIGLTETIISARILDASGERLHALSNLNLIKEMIPQVAAANRDLENDRLLLELDVKLLETILKLGLYENKGQAVTGGIEDIRAITNLAKRLKISKADMQMRLSKLKIGRGSEDKQIRVGLMRIKAILDTTIKE